MTRPEKAVPVQGIHAERGVAHGFGSDARDEAAVIGSFAHIEREIAPIEAPVFDIGVQLRCAVMDLRPWTEAD